MSRIQSQIIDEMNNTASDMATIIGRYKGALTVYAQEIENMSKDRFHQKDEYVRATLQYLADRMWKTIAENEELWDKRGQREAKDADPNTISLDQAVELFNQTQIKVTNQREATDVVQLERA